MQPFASGFGGGVRWPPPLSPITVSTPSEAPVSPSSALSDSTRLGDHDTDDDLTTAGEASPWSFSPRSSSWQRRSTTQTPPPVTAAPPSIVIGNDPNPPKYGDSQFTGDSAASPAQAASQLRKSTAADVGSDANTAAPASHASPASSHPPKPSDAPSYLSFQSSFFRFTSDSTSRSSSSSSSSASAEASNTSESAPPPTQPANSSGVRHARKSSVDEDTTDEASLLSSRSSPLGARGATTPTATTMAATSPPPPPFPPLSVAMTGSTATQVLVPPHGYRTGRARGSHASLPSATSSTPSSQSLLSESEEEGGSLPGVVPREGVTRAEGATTAEAEEPVLTLRVEALDVVGGSPSSRPPSPQHSASSTAGSPLSALAAALTTTYGCPSLSQLATTLLCVDGESAATSFDEAHTSTCVNTAALAWAARPLPLTKEAAQQQRLVSAPLQRTLLTAAPPPAPEAGPVPSESDEVPAHAAVAEDDGLITADAPALPPVLSGGRRRVRRKRQTAAAAMPVAVPEVAAVDSMAGVAQAAAVYPHVQAAEEMQSAVGVPLPELATSPTPLVTPPLSPTDGTDDVPLAWLMKRRLVPTAQSGELPLGDVPLSHLFLTPNGWNGSTSSSAASSATAVLPLHTPAPDEDAVSRRGARRRNRVRGTLSAAAPVPSFPASAPTRTESAAAPEAPEAAEQQAAGGRHVRGARKMSAATANAVDSAAPTAAAAAAADAVAPDAKSPSRTRGTEAAAPPRPRKRARTSAKRSSPSGAPPLRLWWKSVRASAAVPLAGRPCLWIELAPGYQEAHGALLRQVLVCWGRLTQSRDDGDGAAASRSGAKGSTRAHKRQRSPVIATNGLAARHEGGSGAPALTRAAEVGLVVLLCPVAVPMQEALRWWTARAHLEHGYVPPLLAVSLSPSSPGASSQALLQGATTHAARLFAANLSCSLAVSCTAAGYAALAGLLPLAQVFDSLAGCASALAAAVGMPAAALAASDVDAGGCDGEGLAAVLAATSWDARGAGASLQARSFASMCGWNGLAAALQRWPRRPQLLLQHTPLDSKTSRELLKGEVTSAAPAALQPAWVTVGLVCPATRNEDTFSCSAQREARVLAARPPTVALSATHALALCAFARAFFGLENYATSVNVLAAQARLNSRGRADYLSGYSCVTTGPLRYTVSATLRRYLHVRMAVTLAPLLSCVQGAPADPALEPASRLRDTDTMEAAARHDGEARSLGAVLTRLAHVRWRSVLPELSCTCTPRLYEQVPRTDDGTKACRHLAQLFHHFTRQQFCVVGPAAEAGAQGAALLPPSPAPPARAPLPPPPQVPPRPESVDVSAQRCCAPKQQPVEEATDTDLLVNSVPLALLYSHASSLDQDDAHDRDGCGADVAGTTEGTATPVVVHAPRRRRRPAEARARAAAAPLPPASPLLSSPPSADVSAAGSPGAAGSAAAHFHNEAVRYALRLLAQRLPESRGGDHSPNGFGESGGAPLAAPAADRGGTAAGGVRRPRTRRSRVSEPEEQARALQLVEQLLRAQLSPR